MEKNKFAFIGFVVSLISLFLTLGGIVPIVGVVLSCLGRLEIVEKGGEGKGLATAGIIMGIVSLFVVLLGYLLMFVGA